MNRKELLVKFLEKCDFLLENEPFSQEVIIQDYIQYLIHLLNKETHNTGLVLHPGSILFDAVAIVYAAISSIVFNEVRSEDIINALQPGDIVTYIHQDQKKRFVFEGKMDPSRNSSERWVLLSQNGYELWVGKKNWHLIEPYYGSSQTLDGRGMRGKDQRRATVLAQLLEVDEENIPSISDKSVILVMDRNRADYLLNNIQIVYKKQKIKLLDLVTAAYYTENDVYHYAGNPSRNEPLLKITSKVYVARQIVYDKNGNDNDIIGVIFLDDRSIQKNLTEIEDLFHRHSLLFIYLHAHIAHRDRMRLISLSDDLRLFASLPASLTSQHDQVIHSNPLTLQLRNQLQRIKRHSLTTEYYKENEWLNQLPKIRKQLYYLMCEDRDHFYLSQFILWAFSLTNLFLTAPFPLQALEEMIQTHRLQIESPRLRIERLYELLTLVPNQVKDLCETIVCQLEDIYRFLLFHYEALNRLRFYVTQQLGKKCVIIVPKAYYKNVLQYLKIDEPVKRTKSGRLDIMTANHFIPNDDYDYIFVIGLIEGSRFNLFQNVTAENVTVFLHPFQKGRFNYLKRMAEKEERRLLALIREEHDGEYIVTRKEDERDKDEEEYKEFVSIQEELEQFIAKYNELQVHQYIQRHQSSPSKQLADVIAIGSFNDEVRVLFTKYYTAYVFDEEQDVITERAVSELQPGDTLIFTNYNDATRDLVDDILERLITANAIAEDFQVHYKRSKYWKEVLRKYRHEHQISYNELTAELKRVGLNRSPVTIRSWLDEESHIVGPQDVDSFYAIGRLTIDRFLLMDPEQFKESCDRVRSMRIRILKYIGQAILESFKGVEHDDPIYQMIKQNLDDLAVLLELQSITSITRKVPVNLVNRPLYM